MKFLRSAYDMASSIQRLRLRSKIILLLEIIGQNAGRMPCIHGTTMIISGAIDGALLMQMIESGQGIDRCQRHRR